MNSNIIAEQPIQQGVDKSVGEMSRIKQLSGITENTQSDINHLIDLIIDMNLSTPVNLSNELNGKLNAIESQLKRMGINPRRRRT